MKKFLISISLILVGIALFLYGFIAKTPKIDIDSPNNTVITQDFNSVNISDFIGKIILKPALENKVVYDSKNIILDVNDNVLNIRAKKSFFPKRSKHSETLIIYYTKDAKFNISDCIISSEMFLKEVKSLNLENIVGNVNITISDNYNLSSSDTIGIMNRVKYKKDSPYTTNVNIENTVGNFNITNK